MNIRKCYHIEEGEILKWVAIGIVAGGILPALLVLIFFNLKNLIIVAILSGFALFAALFAVTLYRQPDEIVLDDAGIIHLNSPSSTVTLKLAKIHAVRWWPRGYAVLVHSAGMAMFDWRFSGIEDLLRELEAANPDIRISKTFRALVNTWYGMKNDNA